MEPSDLLTRFRHGFQGPAWHGPDTLEILKDVSWQQALARPISGAHTIAELVAHMTTWRTFGLRMLRREFDYRVEISGPQDWPPQDDLDEGGWTALLAALERTQNEILELLRATDDATLDDPAGDRPFSIRVILQGVVDHDIYHGGQIVMLKKLVQQAP